MSEVFDCSVPEHLASGLRASRRTISSGGLVVTPTDTVYGIAADAFNPRAVKALLDAKGRGRNFPPPVLVPDVETLSALAADVPEVAAELVAEFWPGALTLVFTAAPSLAWDLGDTAGTVALRMPNDAVCLELLKDTGPLAVSSANAHGHPAALSVTDAQQMLGDAVDVYLDAGPSSGSEASTIIDVRQASTGGTIRILRHGAISLDAIATIAADVKVVG